MSARRQFSPSIRYLLLFIDLILATCPRAMKRCLLAGEKGDHGKEDYMYCLWSLAKKREHTKKKLYNHVPIDRKGVLKLVGKGL